MEQIRIAPSSEVKENRLLPASAGGTSLLLTRVDGKAYAIGSKCPHVGLPLAKGKVEGGAVTCPWHGSRFDVCTGANLDWCNAVAGIPMPGWTHRLLALGKQPAPLPVYETTEENGNVFVRVPG